MAGSDCAPAPKMATSRHVAAAVAVMADGPSETAMVADFSTRGPSETPRKGTLLVSTREHFLRPSRRRRRGDQRHEVE
ncbi:unnamed protein product [Lampetra planeri]